MSKIESIPGIANRLEDETWKYDPQIYSLLCQDGAEIDQEQMILGDWFFFPGKNLSY